MPPGMYSTIHLFEIIRLSAFKSLLFYPSSQAGTLPLFHLYPYVLCVANCIISTHSSTTSRLIIDLTSCLEKTAQGTLSSTMCCLPASCTKMLSLACIRKIVNSRRFSLPRIFNISRSAMCFSSRNALRSAAVSTLNYCFLKCIVHYFRECTVLGCSQHHELSFLEVHCALLPEMRCAWLQIPQVYFYCFCKCFTFFKCV